MSPVLSVKNLHVELPNGIVIVDAAELEIRAGEVVAILGPSGAGKTTLLRAVLSPGELLARGYRVRWDERHVGADAAFVPQRGALFDHLDVADNIALAQAATGNPRAVLPWLAAVDLDPALGDAGTRVGTLSGGQAQRVAIARTMAAGRAIVVLDEPSVGLDPLGVRQLAALLHRQARERSTAILVITHDLALAAGACDRILFFDRAARKLVAVPWTPGDPRIADPADLAREIERRLGDERRPDAPKRAPRRGSRRWANPFAIAGQAIVGIFRPRLARQSLVVLGRSLVESLLRPLLFYAIVGALLGFTVPYVLTNISKDLGPKGVLKLIGGNYILSLAPPVSAIVFAATSGNAVNAWLGGLQLNGQVLALEGIGVDWRRYLVSSTWLALVISYVVVAIVFVASMVGGGFVLYETSGVEHAFAILTSNFLDPVADQVPNLLRGLWLFGAYAVALASFAVAKGTTPKDEAAHVTAAMTGNVIVSTLFVVTMELASSVLLYAIQGKR